MAKKQTKKVKEERLEDILRSCRNHLRGKADMSNTLEIRKKLIENDKVEAIIVLPREMFYSTDISVTLWILNSAEQIARAAQVYHDWQSVGSRVPRDRYAQPELYCSAFRDELAANNYSLVPSRYIEFVDRDTEINYKTTLAKANAKAAMLLARQREDAAQLKAAFEALGVKVSHEGKRCRMMIQC